MSIENKLVTESYYWICLSTSNKLMPDKLNEFFSGFDFNLLGDDWHDFHTTLTDHDGDYQGIEIFYNEGFAPLYEYIANKLGISVDDIGKNNIKITNI